MSAKNKWKKQIPSDAASFRRPKGSARPGNAILIVTEGLVSEPAYFTALKRRLALQTLEIEVQPGGMGDPQKLVEYAVGLREARRREARNGTLSLSKALDFDEVWIVFDTDVPLAHGRLQAGLAKAASKKIQVAHSTPCFEFWLLLHKTYTTAPMLKCADAVARLESTLTSRYSKASQDAASVIPPLLEGLDTALANAAKIRLHHSAAATQPPANPSYVMVNNNWIPVSDTEFLNIEEDLQGYDLMTFKYNGKTYRSRVTIR